MSEAKIKDGGHKIIKCSGCNKPLIDVWITRPDFDFQAKIRAKCCYCSDSSYLTDIKGIFHIGGISKLLDEETLDDIGITSIESIDYLENGIINVITIKESK